MELKGRVPFFVLFSFTILAAQVSSFPRKKLVSKVVPAGDRRSSRLSTVLSDYWAERGFHDTRNDQMLASESQAKDLMLSGDEMEDFKGVPKVRIPRERLVPPPLRSGRKKRLRVRRPRVRLSPATRKSDMEIMESVTLVDGGTQMADGTIRIRPSATRSQRKQHEGYPNEQGPLSYKLQNDEEVTYYKFNRDQQTQQSRQPTYHTLPAAYQQQQHYQQQQQYAALGKPGVSHKAPKAMHHMSLLKFQKELFENGQLPPQEHPLSLPLGPSSPQEEDKPVSIFVIEPPPMPQQKVKQQQPQLPPQNLPQHQQHHHRPSQNLLQSLHNLQLQQQQPDHSLKQQQPLQTMRHPQPPQQPPQEQPQAPRQNLQGQQQVSHNAQLFQQQFQHPFSSPQADEPSPLAKFTATLISTASTAAAAASAAANVLSQSDVAAQFRNANSPPASSAIPQLSLPSASASSPFSISSVPNGNGPSFSALMSAAAASSQLSPQVLMPTSSTISSPTSSLPPGVIADDENTLQNQLIEAESLAKRLTRMYETGRKILYFPKGVMDTVDTMLKQMERNPMVAYWGDKFFAKVFGDTSMT